LHRQYVNREFLLINLGVLLLLCLYLIIDTPKALVFLAICIVAIGIAGWYISREMESPWILRLVSTILIGLGLWFLIWYFRTGRAILHPIFDPQNYSKSTFESMQESPITATPGK
jgi:hypothetical protein